MTDGLRCPEEPGLAVLNPRHWRRVAEGDGEDVHEGGVRSHYQYSGLLSAGLLTQDVDSEPEEPEGHIATDCPHTILEPRPPTNMRPLVSLLLTDNYIQGHCYLVNLEWDFGSHINEKENISPHLWVGK